MGGSRVAFALRCGAAVSVATGLVVSCGARTGLLAEEGGEPEAVLDAGPETGIPLPDRIVPEDVFANDGFPGDAGDAFPEEFSPHDAFFDDVAPHDAPPPIDAFKSDVVVPSSCPDAAATLIYVITQTSLLYSFDPSAAMFTLIGGIDCPTSPGSQPFSMAVNREGVAYTIFSQESAAGVLEAAGLFRVSMKTAACTPTAYDPTVNGRMTFGMAFVANTADGGDAGETLFLAEDETAPNGATRDGVLATLDTETFALRTVGPFAPSLLQGELTGTGAGRLFAFSPNNTTPAPLPPNPPSFIAEVDPSNAAVIGEDTLPPEVVAGGGWAFGYWGGDFYTFTGPSNGVSGGSAPPGTVVNRFDPSTGAVIQIATTSETIVGAGVSTCAPQN
jgi:hypothetical protein